ncbi:MAG: hypothetical protein AABM29_04625 [Actinomycetota bacterium]
MRRVQATTAPGPPGRRDTLDRAEAITRGHTGVAGLVLAMVAAAALIFWFGRGQSFFADDWNFMLTSRDWSADNLLQPHGGEHLTFFPRLIINTLFEVFGAESQLPFRVVAVSLHLTCAALLYALARRRLGTIAALLPAVVLLFLGAGWEVVMSSFCLPNEMSLAAALGMLLCLDRGDLRGDVSACALLCVSIASFTFGPLFAVGAAVELFLRRGRKRWGRLWVVAIPFALYLAWRYWARSHGAHSAIDSENIAAAPTAVVEVLASGLAAVAGLFATPGAPDLGAELRVRPDVGYVLLLGLGGLIALRHRAGWRPSPRFWAIATILFVNSVSIALVLDPASRATDASRYAYLTAVLILLMLVEVMAGARLTRAGRLAVGAAVGISLVANVAELDPGGRFFREEGEYNRANLGALELTRGQVSPGFVPEDEDANIFSLLPHRDLAFPAGAYFAAVDKLGSPAYSPAELPGAPQAPRISADQLLGRALPVTAQAAPARVPPAAEPSSSPPFPVRPGQVAERGTASVAGDCVRLRPDAGAQARFTLALPPGGFVYGTDPNASVRVRLARFALPVFPVEIAVPPGSAEVLIPTDRSNRPWNALIDTRSELVACPI